MEWCDYLETHARRIYGLATDTVIQGAKRLLRKIKDGVLKDVFSARDVYRQCWTFLDTKEQAEAALDELVETAWLRQIPRPKPNLQAAGFHHRLFRFTPGPWRFSERRLKMEKDLGLFQIFESKRQAIDNPMYSQKINAWIDERNRNGTCRRNRRRFF